MSIIIKIKSILSYALDSCINTWFSFEMMMGENKNHTSHFRYLGIALESDVNQAILGKQLGLFIHPLVEILLLVCLHQYPHQILQ